MVKYVPDRTGRFSQRPHYEPNELDRECENIINGFLRDLYGEARFPVTTDDLTKLIERDADDLDLYAVNASRFTKDLSRLSRACTREGPQVPQMRELSGLEAVHRPIGNDTLIVNRLDHR